MSQPTNEELAQAFGPEAPDAGANKKEQKQKRRKLTKKQKITIVVIIVWFMLIAGAVALAYVLRPKAKEGTTEDGYKWQSSDEQELDVVDVDYYSYYDANDIEFYYPYGYEYDSATGQNSNPEFDARYMRVPQIKGLKNQEVQARINDRIMSVAKEFVTSDEDSLNVHIGANLDNVLSIEFGKNEYDGEHHWSNQRYKGITFDLGTGDEITFDEIFTKSANITALVYKRFYNALSSDYSFDLLAKGRALGEAEAGICVQFCEEGKSVADLKSEMAAIKEKLSNIEEIAQQEAQKYLAGNKEFYLESAGPVLIYDDSKEIAEYYTEDDARYFAFYKKYLTSESLYENDNVGIENMFLTANYGGNVNVAWIEETDNYFVDYEADITGDVEKEKSLQYMRDAVEQILTTRPSSKYMYIHMEGEVHQSNNIYNVANLYITTYVMDKSYYDSTFRKAIFDGKNHSATMSLNKMPRGDGYDESEVVIKETSDYNINYAIIDASGRVYDTAESLFDKNAIGKYVAVRNGYHEAGNVESVDYMGFLKDYFYKNVGEYRNGSYITTTFSEAQKEGHEFELNFSYGDVVITLKNTGDNVRIGLDKIPKIYLKEALR